MFIYAAFFLILSTAVTVAAVGFVRRRRAAVVLGYVDQAVRLNLPLIDMIAAASHSQPGRLGRRLSSLYSAMTSGRSLSDALAMSVPELSVRQLRMIRCGEQMGRLRPMLRRVVKQTYSPLDTHTPQEGFIWAYPLGILLFVAFFVSFIGVVVIPKFLTIFADYGTQLPKITLVVFSYTQFAAPVMTVTLLVIAAGFIGSIMYFCGARFDWLRKLFDPLLWHLPIVRGMVRDRGWADAFAVLAEAFAAGESTQEAMAQLEQTPGNVLMRRRLRRWARRVRDGQSIGHAARACGLPKLAVGMLTGAEQAGQLQSVCRFLSDYYGDRCDRGAALARGAALPATVLVMGAAVGVVVMAMFMPVIALIDAIIPQTGF